MSWNGFCPAGKHGLDYEGQSCDLCAPKPVKRCHVAKPCNDCPFRREGGIRLRKGRIVELAREVAPRDGRGAMFPCHKTVDHDDRDERTEKQCAGALIFAYKQGAVTQMTRIEERLGMIDPALAEGDHPEIFDDVDEWLETAVDGRRTRRDRR